MMNARIAASKPAASTKIVAAAKDIPLGSVLTADDLTSMNVSGAAPKGAILRNEDAVGRGVVSQIYQGEPILESHLAGPGSGGGLAPIIPPGMRACAVKVDEVVGVSGFVGPGMRVDVLVSGVPPEVTNRDQAVNTQTQTVLQNIQVLSAGQQIQRDPQGKPQQVQVVNLLVTPDQAQILSLANTNGSLKIQLVLRNPLDTQVTKVPATPIRNLFSNQTAPAPIGGGGGGAFHVKKAENKPPVKYFIVKISNGSKITEEKFIIPEGLN
jgi:pilus assembly protein CpaB